MTTSRHTPSISNFAGIGFRQIAGWIGSETATGFPIIIFVLLYPMAIGSLQQGFSGYLLPLPTWLWDLLVGLGATKVLILARILKIPNSLANNLGLWTIAALMSAVLPLLVAIPVGAIPDYLILGIPVAALSVFGLLLLFTLAWGAIGDYRVSNKELFKIATELELRRETLNVELARRQKALADQILNEVEPRISHIQELVRNSDSKVAAGEILSLIDNLVRPLSQGLTIATAEENEDSLAVGKRLSFRSVLRRFTRRLGVSSIFTPHLHVIFTTGFFTATMSIAAGFLGVVYLLSFLVFQVLAYWIARKVLGQLQLPYWALFLANLGIASLANLAFVTGSGLAGLEDPEGLIAYVGLGVFLVFVASGYVSIYFAAKQATNQAIRLATERLGYLVGELQIRTASLRKQFALDLHGDLQAKLQAALIRLERSASSDPETIDQVMVSLSEATDGLQNPGSKPVGIKTLKDLPALWDGICDVTISISDLAEAKLREDADLAAVVTEIVRERIINAVKHSSAEEIDISISDEADILVISSRNEDLGVGQSIRKSAGVGSKLLDEVCQSWKLEFESGDMVFEARLAL